MATAVIMPKVDMVMETGTFVEWLKDEGETVEKGAPLFVIMTDKASIEIESPASGILGGVSAQPDDVIPVTEVIAYVLEPGEDLPATPKVGTVTQADSTDEPAPQATMAGQAPEGVEAGKASGDKVRATPVARRLAAELRVELGQIVGRGPRGRIHKADVLAFAEQRAQAPAAAMPPAPAPDLAVPLPPARQKRAVPLAGPRKIIADRMAHSAFTAPHITLTLSVDMSEAARLRAYSMQAIQERTGLRLSYTAILARAVASILPRHPYLNASLNGNEIILWDEVHLGIATSLSPGETSQDDYLIVPVIRGADTKDLEQLVLDLGDLVERARAKRLTPAEMSGSTFTISNLGMFGIESFTAIINPPEAAILAVGKIVDTPVDIEGQIESRPMMQITLSADHRIVDGAAGARFLAELKATLENPYLLI
jgi:pyruvate dehydrogenase E2 component (dihydrolipoamide acetyltransferase)